MLYLHKQVWLLTARTPVSAPYVVALSRIYLHSSGRSEETLEAVEAYLKATKMFRDYSDPNNDPVFSEVRVE